MLSQFTRRANRFPLFICASMLSSAARTGFGFIFSSTACLALLVLLCSVGAPLEAQSQAPDQQAPSSSSSVQSKQQVNETRRTLESRRQQTKRRREAALVTDTYTHRWEVYTGGGYMRFRPGPYIHNSGMGGWIVGATRYFTPRLGITVDVRGFYGNNSLGAVQGGGYNTYNSKFSVFPFTIGPQYRLYGSPKISVTAALQVGDIYGYFDQNTGPFPPASVGFYPASNVGAAIAAVNLDYNLSPGLAVRFAPTVVMDRFGGNFDHNQGLLAGIVYRFGRQ